MIKAFKVMILEDRDTDQILVKRQVLKYNPKSIFTTAEDKTSFMEKIDWFLPDLILADYNLPDFTGLDALMHVKENKPFVPFVFVTGGLRDDDPVASTVLKLADGYVLKNDLLSLHQSLKSIMDNLADKINTSSNHMKEEYEKKVKVLKSLEVLNKSNDFIGKEEVIELLKGLK